MTVVTFDHRLPTTFDYLAIDTIYLLLIEYLRIVDVIYIDRLLISTFFNEKKLVNAHNLPVWLYLQDCVSYSYQKQIFFQLLEKSLKTNFDRLISMINYMDHSG